MLINVPTNATIKINMSVLFSITKSIKKCKNIHKIKLRFKKLQISSITKSTLKA